MPSGLYVKGTSPEEHRCIACTHRGIISNAAIGRLHDDQERRVQDVARPYSARSPGGRSYTTRAPFMRPGARGWSWIKWTHGHANKHAAILEKAKEIGATAWDFGQADHFPTSEYPHQSR